MNKKVYSSGVNGQLNAVSAELQNERRWVSRDNPFANDYDDIPEGDSSILANDFSAAGWTSIHTSHSISFEEFLVDYDLGLQELSKMSSSEDDTFSSFSQEEEEEAFTCEPFLPIEGRFAANHRRAKRRKASLKKKMHDILLGTSGPIESDDSIKVPVGSINMQLKKATATLIVHASPYFNDFLPSNLQVEGSIKLRRDTKQELISAIRSKKHFVKLASHYDILVEDSHRIFTNKARGTTSTSLYSSLMEEIYCAMKKQYATKGGRQILAATLAFEEPEFIHGTMNEVQCSPDIPQSFVPGSHRKHTWKATTGSKVSAITPMHLVATNTYIPPLCAVASNVFR